MLILISINFAVSQIKKVGEGYGTAGGQDVGVLNNQVIQITIKSPIISIFNSLQNECVVCVVGKCALITLLSISMMFNIIVFLRVTYLYIELLHREGSLRFFGRTICVI